MEKYVKQCKDIVAAMEQEQRLKRYNIIVRRHGRQLLFESTKVTFIEAVQLAGRGFFQV